ncbi:lipase family protein [Marinicella sp. W31]|uniref:lipase family protein n=1 Tax=Marinicella sp. W31 TaxID=3023713 RepID=UPI003756ACE2
MPIFTRDLECRLLDACIVAYDIKNGAIDPTVPYYDKIGIKPGTKPYVFVDGVENINAGFVAETYDDWVFLVYRGTLPPFKGDFWAWIADWLNDFRIGPMNWYVNNSYYGQVETGFGSAVIDLWKYVLQALSAIDLTKKKGIIVTGHSKGGGMTFPAASLLKGLYPHMLVQNCSFAAPLTCDRTFQTNYDNMGLKVFTVRYQNQYDIVPFLPYYPNFSMLASAERLNNEGVNKVITEEAAFKLRNDYVRIGNLRYLASGCQVEYGTKGQDQADKDIWSALEHFEFTKIVDAHSAAGRYHTCVCGVQKGD